MGDAADERLEGGRRIALGLDPAQAQGGRGEAVEGFELGGRIGGGGQRDPALPGVGGECGERGPRVGPGGEALVPEVGVVDRDREGVESVREHGGVERGVEGRQPGRGCGVAGSPGPPRPRLAHPTLLDDVSARRRTLATKPSRRSLWIRAGRRSASELGVPRN